eukprot:8326633-Pyramimonas_sp.AAC.1
MQPAVRWCPCRRKLSKHDDPALLSNVRGSIVTLTLLLVDVALPPHNLAALLAEIKKRPAT